QSGRAIFGAASSQIFASLPNDNQWHYIVGTRNLASSQLTLYIDGVAVPVTVNGTNIFSQDPASISVLSQGAANLDELQIYPSALSGADVQALYTHATQTYCVGTRANNSPQWMKINFQQPDPRGGKITASGNLTVTIDADSPTSTINGLTNGQYI